MTESFWFGCSDESNTLQAIAAELGSSHGLFGMDTDAAFDTEMMLEPVDGFTSAYELMRSEFKQRPKYVSIDNAFSPFPCALRVRSGFSEIGSSVLWPNRTWLMTFHGNKGVFSSLYVLVDFKESAIGLFANHKLLACASCRAPYFKADMLRGLSPKLTSDDLEAFVAHLNAGLKHEYASVNEGIRALGIQCHVFQ